MTTTKFLLRFEDGPCAGTTALFEPERYDMEEVAPDEILAFESMHFKRWCHLPNTERFRDQIRFDEERGMQPRGDRIPILIYRRENVGLVDTFGEVSDGLVPGATYVLRDEDESNRWHEYREHDELKFS